ncbi:MAG: hypothetical protein ACI35W_06550 [Anaeroplasmataceae bacterium]
MKAYLLYKDKDYTYSGISNDMYNDLWYNTIVNHLCVYDSYVKDIYLDANNLMTTDIETIKYRQQILKDCIKNKDVIVNYYSFLNELLTSFYNNRYEIKLNEATNSFNACLRIIPDLRMALENMNRYFNEYKKNFKSEGLTNYFNKFLDVFSLDYIEKLNDVFDRIKFKNGIYCNACLDDELNPSGFDIYDVVDEKIEAKNKDSLRANGIKLRNKLSILPQYEYTSKEDKRWKHARMLESPRVTSSAEAEYMMQTDMVLLSVVDKLVSVIDDIVCYLKQTRIELAFYIGGINLYDKLMKLGLPICTPKAHNIDERVFKCDGLYDIALALENNGKVVGNTLDAVGKEIFFITGANQGGKTTFLRSYGQAIIMMQLGLFVSGNTFECNVFSNVFTHFNKEEDKSMTSGKLDEELGRLRDLVSMMKKNALVLFNESFQSTSEIEGSTIAFDAIRALNEKNISVVMVSHMYALYRLLTDKYSDNIYYLRASRLEDGTRSYKLMEALPLETSYALDLYDEIFK